MGESPDRSLLLGFAGSAIRVSTAAAGAYLGTVFGSEVGAATGETFAELGSGAIGFLEARSSARVETTLDLTAKEAERRKVAGETLRDEIVDSGQVGAVTILEAVVDAAARSQEDRKCIVVANLYAAIAFERSISVDDALLYLRRVREASWRQLVALRYFYGSDVQGGQEFEVHEKDGGESQVPPAIAAELSELSVALELVGFRGTNQDGARKPIVSSSSTFGGLSIGSESALGLVPTALGESICKFGQLAAVVTRAELDSLIEELFRMGPNEGVRP